MKYKFYYYYKDFVFTIIADETSIVGLKLRKDTNSDYMYKPTVLIKDTVRQLDEYFAGKRKIFNLPVKTEGTIFQQKVWENLQKIPYGKTVSYKKLAEMSGNPKASRAVGMANNRNPAAIIIPCHRVIGANGQLVGYGGGLNLKTELLELEKNNL